MSRVCATLMKALFNFDDQRAPHSKEWVVEKKPSRMVNASFESPKYISICDEAPCMAIFYQIRAALIAVSLAFI
jgi:hypothetical protein